MAKRGPGVNGYAALARPALHLGLRLCSQIVRLAPFQLVEPIPDRLSLPKLSGKDSLVGWQSIAADSWNGASGARTRPCMGRRRRSRRTPAVAFRRSRRCNLGTAGWEQQWRPARSTRRPGQAAIHIPHERGEGVSLSLLALQDPPGNLGGHDSLPRCVRQFLPFEGSVSVHMVRGTAPASWLALGEAGVEGTQGLSRRADRG
jgi:hypothetical protein